jgi:hypothetical protein
VARGERHAILDGNVKRVLARVFGVEGWPGASAVTKRLWALAEDCTPASAVAAIAAGEPVGQAHDELQAAVAGRSVTPPEPRPIPRPDPTPRDASEPAPRQRDEPRPIASTPGAPAGPRLPSSARIRVAVELGWRAQAWSARKPAVLHGPTVAVAMLASASRLAPGAVVAGQYRLPTHVDDGELDARLTGGAVRALATVEPALGRRVRLRARAGFGVDLLRVAVSGIDRPAASATRALPMFAMGLGAAVRVSARVALALDASLELDLVDTRLVLRSPARTVFDPWRPRPGVGFTVAWDVVAAP